MNNKKAGSGSEDVDNTPNEGLVGERVDLTRPIPGSRRPSVSGLSESALPHLRQDDLVAVLSGQVEAMPRKPLEQGSLEDAAETIFRLAHNLKEHRGDEMMLRSVAGALLACEERLAATGWKWTVGNVERIGMSSHSDSAVIEEAPSGAPDSYATVERERPSAAPDDFQLEDAARSAFDTAMAFGISLDSFMRLAKTVRTMTSAAQGTEEAAEIERLRDEVASLSHYEAMVLENCGELETFVEYRKALESLDLDARRYRRLRVLGAAPCGTKQLENGTVLCFTNLDKFVDGDISTHPSRGEPRSSVTESYIEFDGRAVLSGAARDVLTARRRQIIDEGWTPEHDDIHCRGEMAKAAGCYALYGQYIAHAGTPPPQWPWPWQWWKPSDPRGDLVKAAALILAEIERMDRRTAQQSEVE